MSSDQQENSIKYDKYLKKSSLVCFPSRPGCTDGFQEWLLRSVIGLASEPLASCSHPQAPWRLRVQVSPPSRVHVCVFAAPLFRMRNVKLLHLPLFLLCAHICLGESPLCRYCKTTELLFRVTFSAFSESIFSLTFLVPHTLFIYLRLCFQRSLTDIECWGLNNSSLI